MKYVYKYEDSMRQCETLLAENFTKLSKCSKHLLQSPSSSHFTKAEKVLEWSLEYIITKKKLDTVQGNIATLKSQYNNLTRHNSSSRSFGNHFKEKFYNYLVRQEALRLKFIETINECKLIKSRLDNVLDDCTDDAFNKNSNQTTSNVTYNDSNVVGIGESDLSSIPQICVLLPKLDWDYDDLSAHSYDHETNSFSNEHDEDICTSLDASVSELLEVSFTDLSSNIAVEKYSSTTVIESKQSKNGASSKQNEDSNFSQSLVCNICHRNIKNERMMKRHMFSHEGIKPFECAGCGRLFARKENMKTHIFSMHMPYHSRPYNCHICGKFYPHRSNLNSHKCSTTLSHQSLPKSDQFSSPDGTKKDKKLIASTIRKKVSDRRQSFVCNICDENCRNGDLLRTHMLLHKDLKPVECVECGKSFTTEHLMNQHIRVRHTSYHTRPYKCDFCGKRYVFRSYLNTHKLLSGHNCSSKLLEFSSTDVDDKVTVKERDSIFFLRAKKARKSASSKRKKASNRSCTCNICGKTAGRYYMKSHMITHEALKSFECAECGKSFADKRRVRQHIVLMHINDRSTLDSHYHCAHCNHRCRSRGRLVYHIKTEHMPNLSLEEFGCTVCGKIFSRFAYKIHHERTVHDRKKRFCCTNCGKRYKHDRSLAKHLKLGKCTLE